MNKPTQRFSFLLAAGTALFGLALATTQAQAAPEDQSQRGADRVSVTLTDPSRPALVKASLIDGGITVKAYDGKEVIVEARARNRESAQSDSGPKRIAIATTGLNVEEENNQVNINAESFARTIDLNITVPVHTSLHLSAVNNGDIVVTGVDGELDVNDVNGSVTLNDVAGSAVAHALNGRVLVTFTRVNQQPMAFSSLNGDIDVTFPADLKALVSMRSDRGDVFSDFDVRLATPALSQPIVEDRRSNGGKYRVKIDKTVRGTINGGGPEIQFTNFNGQIYIRKTGASR
jgi:hypothetical protein